VSGATEPLRGTVPARWTRNAVAVPLAEVPRLSVAPFRRAVLELCAAGGRLSAFLPLAAPAPGSGFDLLVAIADDGRGEIALVRADLPASGVYPALTTDLPEAQAFERELMEELGLRPEGHPWPKPLRAHVFGADAPGHPFLRVEGDGLHEVAVGPVHAGIIEPGHFRFQVAGEEVLHLEIHLGYQHRGAERLLLEAPPARRQVVAEAIAGDTTIGHGLAHDLALEALAGAEPPLAGQVLRGVALELERLSNHVGDLGAVSGDVGFLPGAAFYGRLRGEFLNLLLELSGNRFGRGLLVPGGVRFGLGPAGRDDLLDRLELATRDLRDTAAATFDTPSVLSRLEHTGRVSQQAAEELGLVGPSARASGCDRDVRRDHPAGVYRFAHLPVAAARSGDVLARVQVRRIEIRRSLRFVREQVRQLRDGPLAVPLPPLRPTMVAVALVEGWRGEVAHAAATDGSGALAAYKVVDPSFHDWFGLAVAMRGVPISDFPLVNKSFNLSYAGHDL
jgi:Ni,Fe-hydrogenase III large subunit